MQYVEDLVERKEFPEFKAGDTITVHYKIKEGNKERIQNFPAEVVRLKPLLSARLPTALVWSVYSPSAARSSSRLMSTNVALYAVQESSICAILPVRKPVLKRRDVSPYLIAIHLVKKDISSRAVSFLFRNVGKRR